MRHIWFVLSISVYWEESSRGWGGNALCEIFCNVSESTVYNENNGLGKTATRRQSTRALEPLMWKLLLSFFTCFTSLPSSEGKAHVNALRKWLKVENQIRTPLLRRSATVQGVPRGGPEPRANTPTTGQDLWASDYKNTAFLSVSMCSSENSELFICFAWFFSENADLIPLKIR